jgi:hypothetical protein
VNKGFLNLIDLSLNIQRGIQTIRGVTGGVAALMAVGLTVLACGLAPLVWYFDLSATLDYADPLIRELSPTLPTTLVAFSTFVVLAVTLLPTVVELLLPRIGAKVQAAALLVFVFSGVDAVTDWPRVATTMAVYRGGFEQWGIAGMVLWYALHPLLLLFSTFLFELLFVLCVVLILVLVMKIAIQDTVSRKAEPKEGTT